MCQIILPDPIYCYVIILKRKFYWGSYLDEQSNPMKTIEQNGNLSLSQMNSL